MILDGPRVCDFYLSPDEDVGWGQNLGDGDDDCNKVENCKWIQDYFNDYSNDVVVVREVVVKPKDMMSKITYNNYVKDDDDDCVILDGDLDKAIQGQKIQNDARAAFEKEIEGMSSSRLVGDRSSSRTLLPFLDTEDQL
ncbi:hypothetical protein AgCh_000830 [Apium graveolens]